MKDQLISFLVAKLAKKYNFNIVCDKAFYPDGTECNYYPYHNLGENAAYFWRPTQSLLQKWLREKQDLNVEVSWMSEKWFVDVYNLNIPMPNKSMCKSLFNEQEGFKTYEEALEKGLQEALKLI